MTAMYPVPDVFAPSASAERSLPSVLSPPDRPGATLSVLDVSEYYGRDSGGVRTYLHEKARFVASRPEFRQVVVVPSRSASVRTADGVRVYQVPGRRIPFQASYRVLSGSAQFGRIVAHERPDVIEIGSAYAAPWAAIHAARRLGIPLLWYFHAHLPRILAAGAERPAPIRRGAAALAARYVASIARRTDQVLVASESVRRDLESYGVDNVLVSPLGVDTGTYHPARRANRDATLRRYQLPDAPIVLYTGRFTREKELVAVLRAWAGVATAGAMLVLVGAGPQDAELRRLAGRQVRLLPFEHDRERLADLYAAADLYLAPGPAETFGLSAHEALASGTPVLSVDCGAVAEAVRRAECGGLWAHGDRGELAAMVDALLASGGGRAAARAYVVRHHRWEDVLDRQFALYARLRDGQLS